MKFIAVVLCLIIIVTTANAQREDYTTAFAQRAKTVSPLYLPSAAPLQVKPKNLPGQRGIRIGKTLTIIGSGLLVGGIVLVSSADALYYSSNTTNGNTTEEGDIKGGVGVLMIAGGAGMIIPGIIIWTKSKKRYNRYLVDHPQQGVSLNLRGASAGIAYRF